MELVFNLLARIAKLSEAKEAGDEEGVRAASLEAAEMLENIYALEDGLPAEANAMVTQAFVGLFLISIEPLNGQAISAAIKVMLGTHIVVEKDTRRVTYTGSTRTSIG